MALSLSFSLSLFSSLFALFHAVGAEKKKKSSFFSLFGFCRPKCVEYGRPIVKKELFFLSLKEVECFQRREACRIALYVSRTMENVNLSCISFFNLNDK